MDRIKKLMQVFEGDDYLAWLKAGQEIGLLLENENKNKELNNSAKELMDLLKVKFEENEKHRVITPEERREMDMLKYLLTKEGRNALGSARTISDSMELLYDENRYIRDSINRHQIMHRIVETLGAIGKPAISALLEAIKDNNRFVRRIAAYSLSRISDISCVPTLVEALIDEYDDVRNKARSIIYSILEDSATIDRLNELNTKIQEGYGILRKKKRKEDLIKVTLQIANFKMIISQKKNRLVEDKGILLQEMPKPPKKGMYRAMRRSING